MAKAATFTCSNCGTGHSKWSGQCDNCGEWNTLVEATPLSSNPGKSALGNTRGQSITLTDLSANHAHPPRVPAGVEELDRVLGGGLVEGSAILVGGDPGIGKSTLLLQAAARFGRNGLDVMYITGEESAEQVRLRASRLDLQESPVRLAAETNLRNILTTLEKERPKLVVIDSIQTMWLDTIDSAPGSVTQVRSAAHELITYCKRSGTSVILVGHVTKEGQIAGPRVVEHMVDTVLYFEGDRGHQFRILRSVKNRFGAADEIGVFEMTGKGLVEVKNPSAMFLADRGEAVPGSIVFAGIEGTRTMLYEIQALVAPTPHAQARRTVVGLDSARLATILAVLEARCGLPFAGLDVYLNVAGGLRIAEPASDLAVAAALLSAREDKPLPADTVVFGEISLSGGLRAVTQTENRLKEAAKLGFSTAIMPEVKKPAQLSTIRSQQLGDLNEFIDRIFGDGTR